MLYVMFCYDNLRFPDYVTTAQDSGQDVSLTHRPPLPPGNTPGTHFCWWLSWPQGHSAIGRIMWMKNIINTIWDRTSDLPISVWLTLHRAFHENPCSGSRADTRWNMNGRRDEEGDTISVEESALMANWWRRQKWNFIRSSWKMFNLLPHFNQTCNLYNMI